jgi:hypothetical protein
MVLPKPGVSLITYFDLCLCRRKLAVERISPISAARSSISFSGLRQALNVGRYLT